MHCCTLCSTKSSLSLTLESSFFWICSICSETNFSHSTSSLASVTSPNHFSVLSDETSIQRPKPGHGKAQKAVKILNVNCQSVANKKAEFFSLLDHHNPDIVIGTESWLSSKHSDSKIFPKSLGYTSFRKDRCSETHGGGVFILVRYSFVATEQRELSTDCKLFGSNWSWGDVRLCILLLTTGLMKMIAQF